jgi:hypothetical protein
VLCPHIEIQFVSVLAQSGDGVAKTGPKLAKSENIQTHGFQDIVEKDVKAAVDRSVELGKPSS